VFDIKEKFPEIRVVNGMDRKVDNGVGGGINLVAFQICEVLIFL
jgi:hypothetical protein